MLILSDKPFTKEQVKEASKDLDKYIKFVVDIEKRVVTIGGKRHYEGEKILLENGSKQEDVWGGGIDLEADCIDFDAIINIRPRQNNPSKEVLSNETRESLIQIVKEFNLWKN
jgi:hypothetical protein